MLWVETYRRTAVVLNALALATSLPLWVLSGSLSYLAALSRLAAGASIGSTHQHDRKSVVELACNTTGAIVEPEPWRNADCL